MKMELDFVRRPLRIGAPGAALLAFGIIAAAVSVQQYMAVSAEIAARQSEPDAGPQAAARGRAGAAVDLEQLRARLLAANQILEKRTVPWDALFRDIESASDKQVGLLSVQPEPAARVVRITGEAHDAAALAAYIERLEQKPSLGNVYLTGHELRQEQGRTVIRFALSANWTAEPA